MPATTIIKLRRGTAAAWTSANPTLAAGEEGHETDTGLRKVGDGTTAWTSLAYHNPVQAGTYAEYVALAAEPDLLIFGVLTRDGNGVVTSAPVIWPNGQPGTYTATTISSAFLGATDAYTITYGSPVTRTYTQPAVTRDGNGAITTRPAITIS